MLTVMDMSTGKIIEEEFGSFEDQVLNAEWLPRPEVQLGLQPAVGHPAARLPIQDAESFLKNIYMSQE
jgi:hypothetical protein